MLTQEDFVAAPKMSGETSLQRSSWKAEAIRRGDLKISGPFPITEETPLSEDEEREFAEKQNAASPTTPSPELISSPIQPPRPPPAPPVAQDDHMLSLPEHAEEQREEIRELEETPLAINAPAPVSAPAPAPAPATTPTPVPGPMRRGSPEHVSYGSPSPFPSLPESSTQTTPKKKRSSGLRNVFRKMFGKRSRSREEPRDQENRTSRHGHHRSEPVTLHESPKMTREDVSGPRISDLPVRELEPLNPLGQHLPFPMNVNAPQESSPPHQYLTFEVPPQLNRRRATLPSVLLSESEAQALKNSLHGSSQHLPTWDERHDNESIPSPQIGIALSSPPPAGATPQGGATQSVREKRRSRSAGALRDLAKAGMRPSIERRRSAEIRYWRSSYQSGSVYSRPQTAKTVETVKSIGSHDDNAKALESAAEPKTATTVDADDERSVAQHDQDISQIPLPVDAFNFGNLRSDFSDDEPTGDRPEVPSRSEKRLSIEERVQNLEDDMRTLEGSVRRLSGRSNRQTIILENAPQGRRSRDRSSSATSDCQASYHSSKGSHKTLSLKQEESGPALSSVNEFPSSTDRNTVIALEPSAIPRPNTAEQSDTSAQFANVYEALKQERCARRALEKQVNTLQREVADLHALVNKFISRSPSYPTPSPDAVIASNEERMSTPRASTRPERGLGFDSEGEGTARRTRETVLSRFSQSDSEGGDQSLSSSREDLVSPEAWATPKEESGFGSGFFSTRKQSNDGQDEMF